MNDEEKMTAIHFALPTHKKNAYVRAAQQRGQKLVPWVLEALDKAACETTQPGESTRETKTRKTLDIGI
ncbi:hypothetical protein CO615_10480 [Lysobacteraceae bacterium NML75-0749]|nr:hypothetical protein CO615_10480 [Xanthomonadaceae bacterium NML75-0749]